MDFKEEFHRLVSENIHRSGIRELMLWLDQTDFFESPASTKYHGAFKGGLVQHSLNVYRHLRALSQFYKLTDATSESIAIVSLFHDVCKVGTYKVELRWRKNEQNQWEQYETYGREEKFAFGGHGSKSVYLVQSFMRLTPDEASAINCHMGQWEATKFGDPSVVYERNKLAWLLHVADEAATYSEQEDKNG